jgi:hypothetical protein
MLESDSKFPSESDLILLKQGFSANMGVGRSFFALFLAHFFG